MTTPFRQPPASINSRVPEISGGRDRETTAPESRQSPAPISGHAVGGLRDAASPIASASGPEARSATIGSASRDRANETTPDFSPGAAVVLIVEDEAKLAGLMRDYLAQAGFATHLIADGLAVVPWLRQHRVDLMVLDLMLPGQDGVAICRAVREFSDLPIIMATARVAEEDRLRGLGIGADDYLCKPFSLREMVARVQAILRRSGRQPAAAAATSHLPSSQPRSAASSEQGGFVASVSSAAPVTAVPVSATAVPMSATAALASAKAEFRASSDAPTASTVPVLSLREDRFEALLRGRRLDLTVVEFKLLLTLASHPGRVFSREHLMQRIYTEYRVVSDRTIDSHIKKLRHKMRAVAPDLDLIHSMYGAGYRYVDPPTDQAGQGDGAPQGGGRVT